MFMIFRRKTLKQAQLSLHKVLHPHSHQKPVLRIILCNAIYEIKVSSPAQWRIQWVNWYVLVCCGYIITTTALVEHSIMLCSHLSWPHMLETLLSLSLLSIYIISIIIQCVATSTDSSLLIRYLMLSLLLLSMQYCLHVRPVGMLSEWLYYCYVP